ncbi:hypothetical protein [Nesterenkonia rhizosphaerae]|uniref:Uncharacterized protein n=1 Tax=Nesterenkonia rhizosphaerae TaxID=1348272 RepID=A0ABP9G0G8_9MICC
MNNLYMLTHLTGQTSQTERTAVIGFIEMRRRVLMILIFSGVPGLLVMLILTPILKAWAILALPIIIFTALWIFESRSRRGLQLRTWQHLTEKQKSARSGEVFHQCGRPVSVGDHWMRLVPASVPVQTFDPEPEDPFTTFNFHSAMNS